MVIIAMIWAVFSAAAIAVGLERPQKLKEIAGVELAATTPGFLLLGGLIVGIIVLVLSFAYFVTKNALFVLAAWAFVFALLRLIIETLGRKNPYQG